MRDYGMQTMFDEQRDKIRENNLKVAEDHLTGIHTYDILRNQNYIKQFQYVSADTDERADIIIDGTEGG